MTSKAVLLSIILIGGVSNVAMADSSSEADQRACEPEVHRLCDQYIPDEAQIVACLKKELKHLNPACKKVIARTM